MVREEERIRVSSAQDIQGTTTPTNRNGGLNDGLGIDDFGFGGYLFHWVLRFDVETPVVDKPVLYGKGILS